MVLVYKLSHVNYSIRVRGRPNVLLPVSQTVSKCCVGNSSNAWQFSCRPYFWPRWSTTASFFASSSRWSTVLCVCFVFSGFSSSSALVSSQTQGAGYACFAQVYLRDASFLLSLLCSESLLYRHISQHWKIDFPLLVILFKNSYIAQVLISIFLQRLTSKKTNRGNAADSWASAFDFWACFRP